MKGASVSHDVDKLVVRAPFEWKEACKAIPGARWNATLKAWVYPVTAMAARSIAETFPKGCVWDDAAMALLKESEAILAAGRHKTATDGPPIPLVKTKPWQHQVQAFNFAKNLPAVMLALEMGVGKTKIAIDLLVNRNCQRVLIVCPKSVVDVWPFQFEQHSAVPFIVVACKDGSVKDRAHQATQAFALAQARKQPIAVVVNYEAAWMAGMGAWIMGTRWDAVVLDESHRIKQPGGKASLFFGRLGDRVPFKMCLTGTPFAHSPLCAYGQYRFLDKGIFGTSFTVFRAKYAILQQVGSNPAAKKIIGYQNQSELQEKFYSIAFRVKAEDVLDLPESVDVMRPVTIGAHARRVYAQLKEQFVADFGAGTVTAGNALTRLLRLQQIASGWVKQDDSIETGKEGHLMQVDDEKQKMLLDVLEDLADEEPIVVFCRFRHDLDAVHTVAAALGRRSLELSGQRNELAAWQSGAAPVLAVQIQSGGVGVDLVRSRYAIYFSLGFSLSDYLQSRKRIHRPGQKRSCTYIHLVASNTVDVQVYQALQQREEIVNVILSQGVL